MTANLIAYWRHKEDARHNRETESLNRDVLDENKRHNLETESHNRNVLEYNYVALEETKLHNRTTEAIGWKNVYEQIRHNQAQEALTSQQIVLGQQQLAEQRRANLAREAENRRYNRAHMIETHRSNVARENESHRHNEALETLESRRVFTSQRAQDLAESRFELEKTKYQTDVFFDAADMGLDAAKIVTGLFAGKKKGA